MWYSGSNSLSTKPINIMRKKKTLSLAAIQNIDVPRYIYRKIWYYWKIDHLGSHHEGQDEIIINSHIKEWVQKDHGILQYDPTIFGTGGKRPAKKNKLQSQTYW